MEWLQQEELQVLYDRVLENRLIFQQNEWGMERGCRSCSEYNENNYVAECLRITIKEVW